MQIAPGIFKAYDIRGIYPTELNEEGAYAIGRAFVTFLQAREGDRWS
jgi:phosphomannomutase (EC 5.4.2.8)